MKTRYIVGNWKLQGTSQSVQERLVAFSSQSFDQNVQVVLCPPFVYLDRCYQFLNKEKPELLLGAQNISAETQGAFTGEISGAMLKDIGCHYTLIGHSERRQCYLEDDALIARKLLTAYDAGLTPILCIGESLAEREADQTVERISHQLQSALGKLTDRSNLSLLVAYEPIWAIGTGVSASPEQAEQVHQHIKSWLTSNGFAKTVPILYGGSVKPNNVKALLGQPSIDGVLVGGASWDISAFRDICKIANES